LIVYKISQEKQDLSNPDRLKLAFEELGTTFIKLGEFMVTRPDIIPTDYIEAFTKLQDDVKAVSFVKMKQVIAKEWGDQWQNKFASFDENTIASASIAQVYKAKTTDGKVVANKIQKPDIKDKVEADLRMISFTGNMIEKNFDWAKTMQISKIIEEFALNLKRELDFEREAILIQKFRVNYKDNNEVVIPEVIKELSTQKIVTMSFIDGKKINQCKFTEEEKTRVAKMGLHIFVKQILEDGIFHANPYAGNLLYTKEGKISYLDFGLVGRLTPSMRYQLIDLLLAIHSNEAEWILREILNIGEFTDEIDKNLLVREIMEITDKYIGIPIKELSLGQALLDLFDMIRRYHIRIHPSYAIMVKTIMTAESVAHYLDEDLDVINEISSQVKKAAAERMGPKNIYLNLKMFSKDVFQLIKEMPI
jgi:ubiquinone biosynthesis protein